MQYHVIRPLVDAILHFVKSTHKLTNFSQLIQMLRTSFYTY